MNELEHGILGVIFAVCAAILYLYAVPVYALRHVGPGRPPPLPTGKVRIAGFALLDVIGVSLFFALYAFAWSTGGPGGDENSPSRELDNGLLLENFATQILFVLVVLAMLVWRMNLVQAWGLRWSGWPWVFLYVPVALILMTGLGALLMATGYFEWMAELTGNDPDEPSQETVQLLKDSEDPLTLALLAVVACVGAPLMEEVVFRGYIYAVVKRFSSIPVAVVFSSVLFGVVHLDLTSFLRLTVLGVILALLYERTGSLWMPLAVHFSFNATTVGYHFASKLKPEWFEELEKNAALIGLG